MKKNTNPQKEQQLTSRLFAIFTKKHSFFSGDRFFTGELYTTLANVFIVVFCVLKCFNFGVLSVIYLIPIIFYISLFARANTVNAKIENKTIIDHIRFWILSFFFLLSALTFVDLKSGFGSNPISEDTILNISSNSSKKICALSVVITIIMSIISISKRVKQKSSHNNKINNK